MNLPALDSPLTYIGTRNILAVPGEHAVELIMGRISQAPSVVSARMI
jgi:hypothetical protein